ncbi:MAG: ABC transporter permease, partial [Tissierellia bacterium]|nr:ABC transporter permease [Tissierellia bacterium]MDD3226243.1 ABC transporter permease [Tissierellia bacterium]
MWKKKYEPVANISKEHDEYLKLINREKNFIRIAQILIFVLGIIFWEVAARNNLIDTFLTSSPGAIF